MQAGFLLRRLLRGEILGMPHTRPMPQLGRGAYELRVRDDNQNWRVMERLDADAVVIAEVFSKRTRTTPTKVIEACRERLRRYDQAAKG